MVACLSFAIPIWIRNGYQFKVPQVQCAATPGGNDQPPGKKEVCSLMPPSLSSTNVVSGSNGLIICVLANTYQTCTEHDCYSLILGVFSIAIWLFCNFDQCGM